MTALTLSSQTSTISDPYYPQSDEAEFNRIQALANSAGLGDPINEPGYQDDVTGFFDDIGMTGREQNG